jgi:hypothetical protein
MEKSLRRFEIIIIAIAVLYTVKVQSYFTIGLLIWIHKEQTQKL